MELTIKNLFENLDKNVFFNGMKIFLSDNHAMENLIVSKKSNIYKFTYQIFDEYRSLSYQVGIKVQENETFYLDGYLCRCLHHTGKKEICEHVVFLFLMVLEYLQIENNEFEIYIYY